MNLLRLSAAKGSECCTRPWALGYSYGEQNIFCMTHFCKKIYNDDRESRQSSTIHSTIEEGYRNAQAYIAK